MSITVDSTTDTEEAVTAARGDLAQKKDTQAQEATEPKEQEESEDSSVSQEDVQEDDDSHDSEGHESDDDGDDEESSESNESKPKKKGGFKRKIEKLSSKLSEAEKEAELWRREALKIRESEQQSETKEAGFKPESDLSEKPNPDDFDDQASYIEALTDWKLENKFSEQQAKQKEQQLIERQNQERMSFQEKIKEFAAKTPDWDEALEDVDDIPMSLTVQEVVLESGPELMYALAKNRDEYKRICSMSPIAAAKALGVFEARLKTKQGSSVEKAETKTTKAPKPISPVGSNKSGASTKSPENMSYQEYKRWREAHS